MFFSKTIHPQEIQKKLSLKSKKSRKLQKIGGKSWYTTRFDMILPLGSSGPMFFFWEKSFVFVKGLSSLRFSSSYHGDVELCEENPEMSAGQKIFEWRQELIWAMQSWRG